MLIKNYFKGAINELKNIIIIECEQNVSGLTRCWPQIYSLSKETDVDALVAMDRAAEKLASALFFRGGCDAVGAEATCRPYVCANFFLRCDEDGTAPMPVCRSECVICLQTCRYERTILAPGQ